MKTKGITVQSETLTKTSILEDNAQQVSDSNDKWQRA
jgi:hypothetical protein